MVVSGDGETVWLVDNDNHRLIRFGTDADQPALFGVKGEALGQLRHPFMAAAGKNGDLFVSDVINGRPFRFESPCGITFDAEGHLYVVELVPARVRKLKIAANPQAAPLAETPRREVAAGNRARNCTVCHLEWMPQFDQGRGTRLMDPPDSPANDPLVSRSAACLSCHGGSVVDSRRRVWQEHGHLTGVEPSASVKVPPHLPPLNGQNAGGLAASKPTRRFNHTLSCSACHNSHGDSEESPALLIVDPPVQDRCDSCPQRKRRPGGFGRSRPFGAGCAGLGPVTPPAPGWS